MKRILLTFVVAFAAIPFVFMAGCAAGTAKAQIHAPPSPAPAPVVSPAQRKADILDEIASHGLRVHWVSWKIVDEYTMVEDPDNPGTMTRALVERAKPRIHAQGDALKVKAYVLNEPGLSSVAEVKTLKTRLVPKRPLVEFNRDYIEYEGYNPATGEHIVCVKAQSPVGWQMFDEAGGPVPLHPPRVYAYDKAERNVRAVYDRMHHANYLTINREATTAYGEEKDAAEERFNVANLKAADWLPDTLKPTTAQTTGSVGAQVKQATGTSSVQDPPATRRRSVR